VIGSITGGNLTALPQTAIDRFVQFHQNPLLGLYNLDFLNLIVQLIFIPTYLALYAVHSNKHGAWAGVALVIFLIGTTVMVTNNSTVDA